MGSSKGGSPTLRGRLIRTDSDAYLLVGSTYRHYVSERFAHPARILGSRSGPTPYRSQCPGESAVTGLFRTRERLKSSTQKSSYDVVIIGGGGHGLALAYYLAQRHGIRDVAVIERSYIGSGATGRNTTVLRANYKAPQTIPFFKASFELYRKLGAELDFNLLLSQRGLLWLAHSESSLRIQRERAFINQALGVDTVFVTPDEIAELCPVLDLDAGGKQPVLGAAYHSPGSIIRHDAVVWGYAAAAQQHGVHVHQGLEVTGIMLTTVAASASRQPAALSPRARW